MQIGENSVRKFKFEKPVRNTPVRQAKLESSAIQDLGIKNTSRSPPLLTDNRKSVTLVSVGSGNAVLACGDD